MAMSDDTADKIIDFSSECYRRLIDAHAEIEHLLASRERLKSAIEWAHAEGFQWPSDPLEEFVNEQITTKEWCSGIGVFKDTTGEK